MKHTITILGRRWRDKVYGNTYHSARVMVDGNLVAVVPFQYGYGNQFEWNAVAALEASDAAKDWTPRKHHKNGSAQPGWDWLRDGLGFGYVVDVADCKKRECVEWGKP